jgi:hypothetical protein
MRLEEGLRLESDRVVSLVPPGVLNRTNYKKELDDAYGKIAHAIASLFLMKSGECEMSFVVGDFVFQDCLLQLISRAEWEWSRSNSVARLAHDSRHLPEPCPQLLTTASVDARICFTG